MGRWFPGFRTGTPEQIQAYRAAKYDLDRNARYEHAAGIRDETERYLDLNHRVCETARPLHPVQRWWHFQRASDAEDRDFMRLRRQSDRQDRGTRREDTVNSTVGTKVSNAWYRIASRRTEGGPHRDDREMGRTADAALAQAPRNREAAREAPAPPVTGARARAAEETRPRQYAQRQPPPGYGCGWDWEKAAYRSGGNPDPLQARTLPARTERSPR